LTASLRDLRAQIHYRVANLFLRLHRYEAAANAFGRVLRFRPDDPHVRFQRAWSLLEVPHRRTEGIKGFEALLKDLPSGGGYYLMACGLQKESRHDEAVRAFREAERLDGAGTADLHYNLAVSLTTLRRLEEAADAFHSAALLSPSDAEAWANLGATFAELGRWKDAAPCQERAMRLSPSVPQGLDLGATLYELDRLDEAERVLRESLALDPESAEAKEMLAQVLAGQDRCDDATRLAREICALNPASGSARTVLAGVLMEAGRLDDALKEAKVAISIAPVDPRAHNTLGAILIRMKDGTNALAAFERMAACLDPSADRVPAHGWVWCYMGRGASLGLLGRHDEAMTAFDQLLRLDSDFFERWPELAPHYELSSGKHGSAKHTPS
jgi:tetratricopeptide (TPR) repeat protein